MVTDSDIEVPRNVEAERALIGACMQHGPSFEEAQRVVRDDDFWSNAHGVIWQHLRVLADNGPSKADREGRAVAIFSSLTKTNELQAVGGANYLHDLMSHPFASTNVGYSATLVHEAARARRALQISTRIHQVIGENNHDHERMLELLAARSSTSRCSSTSAPARTRSRA
jgi:replicative DNA helicase